MKVTAMFMDRPPVALEAEPDRMTIEHAGKFYRVSVTNDGLLSVRLDYPLGCALVIYPHASNGVDLGAISFDERSPRTRRKRGRRG